MFMDADRELDLPCEEGYFIKGISVTYCLVQFLFSLYTDREEILLSL